MADLVNSPGDPQPKRRLPLCPTCGGDLQREPGETPIVEPGRVEWPMGRWHCPEFHDLTSIADQLPR